MSPGSSSSSSDHSSGDSSPRLFYEASPSTVQDGGKRTLDTKQNAILKYSNTFSSSAQSRHAQSKRGHFKSKGGCFKDRKSVV